MASFLPFLVLCLCSRSPSPSTSPIEEWVVVNNDDSPGDLPVFVQFTDEIREGALQIPDPTKGIFHKASKVVVSSIPTPEDATKKVAGAVLSFGAASVVAPAVSSLAALGGPAGLAVQLIVNTLLASVVSKLGENSAGEVLQSLKEKKPSADSTEIESNQQHEQFEVVGKPQKSFRQRSMF